MAKALLRKGFERVQYSVFIGGIEPKQWEKLWEQLQKQAVNHMQPTDQICSFIIAPEQFRNLQVIGSPPDVEYILGEKLVLYL